MGGIGMGGWCWRGGRLDWREDWKMMIGGEISVIWIILLGRYNGWIYHFA